LPGEGQWQTVATVKGAPAVRVAAVRPDDQHTSFVTGVLWLDPNLVRGQLQPGYLDPGGSWQAAPSITPATQSGIVAAFNAGFRFYQSHGGYYSEGRTPAPLQDGAASLVLDKDGRASVGSWNNEVRWRRPTLGAALLRPDIPQIRTRRCYRPSRVASWSRWNSASP
jgi:hypothetical protein